MSKQKKQIKWRVVGINGWDRKGEYQGAYTVEISFQHGQRHYEIMFGAQRYGSYGTSDEEMERAKADAERLMPEWVAQRKADAEARKAADARKAEAIRVHQARLDTVLASLKALGIQAHDNFGSVALNVDTAEALIARLSGASADPTTAVESLS